MYVQPNITKIATFLSLIGADEAYERKFARETTRWWFPPDFRFNTSQPETESDTEKEEFHSQTPPQDEHKDG